MSAKSKLNISIYICQVRDRSTASKVALISKIYICTCSFTKIVYLYICWDGIDVLLRMALVWVLELGVSELERNSLQER